MTPICTTPRRARAILLYSVGENGKDDGGRTYGEHDPKNPEHECDDIAVRMPRGK